MQVSATTWSTLSKLLDEALDLESAARAVWLEQLSATQPALAPSVRQLLAAHASSETADVLARLPTLDSTAAAVTRVSALAAGDRIGPYRLKRELGAGGMADVWLAERADGAFTREVALKLPLINRLRRDLAQRFARERDILARLEHPHIARLYDAGVSQDGLPYLAMEYVDGQPITEHCDNSRLDVSARLRLFAQVLDAVQFAHANLVIHRDLKPSNILVTTDGQVRLLDFGIAKLLADSDTAHETQLTRMAGRALTPDYASPEQIKGEPLTIATDVYSLAVVLYELLAGTRPYRLKVQSAAQLEQAIVAAEPQRPSGAVTEQAAQARAGNRKRLTRLLAGDLETIVLKALEKLPAQRYLTIAAFAEDLQRYLSGRPVRARPASLNYRTRKFVLRNKLPVGAAISVLSAVVAGAVVALWQADEARQQAQAAQREAKALSIVSSFMLEAFSKVAAEPSIAAGNGHQVMSETLKSVLANTEAKHRAEPKALAAVYGAASSMFIYTQRQTEAMDAAIKELQYLKDAGEPPTMIATAHRQIALSHYRRHEYDKATANLESAIAVLGAERSENARLTRANVLRLLATVQESQGSFARMEQVLDTARKELEPDLQSTNQYYGAVLLDLARVKSIRGEDAEPVALIEKAREIFKRLPGLRESEWGGLEFASGVHDLQIGRYEKARGSFRKAAELYGKEFGTDGPNAAGIDALIAAAALRLGDYAEAESLLLRARQILSRRKDFSNRALMTRTQLNLAELYLEDGDLSQASNALYEINPKELNNPLTHVRYAMLNARLLSETGRYAGALERLEAVEREHSIFLSEAIRPQKTLDVLRASILLDSGDAGHAHEYLAAAMRRTPRGEGDDASTPIIRNLKTALVLEQPAGPEQTALLDGTATNTDWSAMPRASRTGAVAQINHARVLLELNKPEDAKAQLQHALRSLENQYSGSPLRATALAWLAVAYADLNEAENAKASLTNAERLLVGNSAVGEHYWRPVRAARTHLSARKMVLGGLGADPAR